MQYLYVLKMASSVLLASVALAANAATIAYTDFSDTAGLTINGDSSAVVVGGRSVLRVTPAQFFKSGSVFGTTAASFGPNYNFSTRFTFNLNGQRGGGADGLVFVIQANSNTVGGSGGGIGYKGIGNSLGVEFDTFNNGAIDQNSNNHIGIDLNGSLASLAQNNALPFILDSRRDLTSWIDYDGSTQTIEVRLNDSAVRPLTSVLSYRFDLGAVLGSQNAFVGFTSGTGGGAANHDLIAWEFSSASDPVVAAVPEPSTWAMMILGFGLAGASLRVRLRKSHAPAS